MSGLICGVKLTHDGCVCVIDGDRLVFSTEVEKIANTSRYSELADLSTIEDVLSAEGIALGDLDSLCVDGWLSPSPEQPPVIQVSRNAHDARQYSVEVAGYAEHPDCPDILDRRFVGDPLGSVPSRIEIGGHQLDAKSYQHATDHVFASYCTSPYAAESRAAYIVVWDGYMRPLLYLYEPDRRKLASLGPVADLCGGAYPSFASVLPAFRRPDERADLGKVAPGSVGMLRPFLNLSGKVMAYAGLAEPNADVIEVFRSVAEDTPPGDARSAFKWSRRAYEQLRHLDESDACLVASLQQYFYETLESGLKSKLSTLGIADRQLPLCLSGGCALNIKWNSALRASGMFEDVWVPPFPNDAGSAIGAACTEMIQRGGSAALRWSVFSGPSIVQNGESNGAWTAEKATIGDLAGLLHETQAPVVVLSGRAELGPRALGHRSIIAPACDAEMKDRLNRIKGREWYRPVAPICLESAAPDVFSPGSRDPYMLFDHHVRGEWRERVPAILHTDGTARLQTVGEDNPVMYELLTAYEAVSGIPVLCNTSANLKGCGFFPDVRSAQDWGGADYVWSDGLLYRRCGSR